MESEIDKIIYRISGDPSYIDFLIAEQDYIRSALLAKGVCFDEDYLQDYPDAIGSALHCDLIELDLWVQQLSPVDRMIIRQYANMQDHVPSYGKPAIRHYKRLEKRLAKRLRMDKPERINGEHRT